jgi:hypothetical protein
VGTAVSNTTTDNPTYNDLLAIWDAHNGSGKSTGDSGVPAGWQADDYWSATPSASGHAYVYLNDGYVYDNTSSFNYVALQVLNPATFTSASYERVSNTFKLTGTDMGSLGKVGTDIKSYIDWTQFDYDTTGDGVVDVNFTASDIASAKVTSDTTMEVVLNAGGASRLEGNADFDTSAAVNGADKVVLAANAANNYSNAANLGVTQATSQAGLSVIDLGAGNGKLIAPVQVEGKWYYFWDRSGDGTSLGADTTSHDVLDGIFNKDINGVANTTVQNKDGLYGTTETYRYGSINGVKLALPTDGNPSSSSHFVTSNAYGGTYDPASPGTSGNAQENPNSFYYAKGTSGTAGAGTTTNAGYDDLLAIWDATNATKNDSYPQAGGVSNFSGYEGVPAGWQAHYYWSATPSVSGHASVYLNNGSVFDDLDGIDFYVALQVL